MLYVDLDGVLADFDKACVELTGFKPVDGKRQGIMWAAMAKHPNFFGSLDWMPDGEELWDYCKQYKPTILTGIPRGGWAAKQKREWCYRKLGYDVPVITCFSSNKPDYCNPGDILVDDRTKIMEQWKMKGGLYILHTSAKESIEHLTRYFDDMNDNY